jgi:hypothetical protein
MMDPEIIGSGFSFITVQYYVLLVLPIAGGVVEIIG